MSELGELLTEIRKKIKATPTEISSNLGVSRGTYSMYEHGTRFPNKEIYKKLDEHYNFNQFKNVKEAILDDISDYLAKASMYDLFLLDWKLKNKE